MGEEMSRAPSRLRDFLCNEKLVRNPRGWSNVMAEEAELEILPDWLFNKIPIDDVKTSKKPIFINLKDFKIILPTQGEE